MLFGEKLKELRLNRAKMGLREFANHIDIKPSELSDLERGHAKPPDDDKWYWKIVYALGIQSDLPEQMVFKKLWKKPFVMQYMTEGLPKIPFPPHDKDGNYVPVDKVIGLSQWLNDEAVEHNKKARKYNESQRKEVEK